MDSSLGLIRKILSKHTDPSTKAPELIALEWRDNEMASEHLSRHVFVSKFAKGIVLDLASGTCCGSSILRRGGTVKALTSVYIESNIFQYGRVIFGVDCVRADATYLPFRERCFDTVVSIETKSGR
ncbi:MAG: class I SAM-dependent methyltransferase [Ignisphaera sp.]